MILILVEPFTCRTKPGQSQPDSRLIYAMASCLDLRSLRMHQFGTPSNVQHVA